MKQILFFLLFFLCYSFSVAQDGTIDHSFNTTDVGYGYGDGADNAIESTIIQPDGKIIIGGQFTGYNATGVNYLTRLNYDGTIDSTFNPGGSGAYFGSIFAMALQSDGKIIIAGGFTNYNGTAINRIARLNTDGSLDTTFNIGEGFNDNIFSIALQSNGKIIVGGTFTTCDGVTRNRIARLNIDGSLDNTFNPNSGPNGELYSIALQSDGKIIIGGYFSTYNISQAYGLARLNADGSIDTTFNIGTATYYNTYSIVIQSDGKVIVGGFFSNNITRLNSNGSLDTTFNSGTGANGGVFTTTLQPDGKIIIGGNFTNYNGTAINSLARLNADGSLDTSLNTGSGIDGRVNLITFVPGGKIMVAGIFNSYNGIQKGSFIRLNSDGILDTTFNGGSGANGQIISTSIQPDGKIIIGGDFTIFNGVLKNRITRLNTDGSLDITFDSGTGANNPIYSTLLQPDGKIIITGNFTSYNGITRFHIARLNLDGSLDTTFNSSYEDNYPVNSVALQPDGKIIIVGSFNSYNGISRNGIARLNPDGSLDPTFNPGSGVYYLYTTTLQPDGKIIIGGNFTSYDGITNNNIARLNVDGSLDTTFNIGSGTDGSIRTITLQADGKIIIGGYFTNYNGTIRNSIARLNPDGSLDTTFNIGSGTNQNINSIVLQPDGKIIIGGNFTSYNDTPSYFLARLHTEGSLDTTFNTGFGGANNFVRTIAFQSDGKAVIGGAFTNYNGTGRNRIARLNGYVLGVEQYNDSSKFKVFPNPTQKQLYFQLENEASIDKIIITDLTGKIILIQSQNAKTLNVENLAKGIYIIEIFSGNNKFQSKFVKE